MKDCEFGTLKDDLMLHVLIRGLDSERMWRCLFETDNLELPKAIRMCQGMAADLQSWGEAKNGSPEVVAAVKGTTKESFGDEDSEGVALVSRAPNDQGSSSRNGAAMGFKTQESWVRRNPKGKGCPKCGRDFIRMDSALHLVKCAGNVEARTILQNSVLLSKT